MNLQFITSVSKEYWERTAKYCIGTWNLPGNLTIYIDQEEGEVEWFNDIKHKKLLLHVPTLKFSDGDESTRTKIRKFWGKSCAQIHAIRNRQEDTRIVWLDADLEQIGNAPEALFSYNYGSKPVALMRSSNDPNIPDCWETGLVIFNYENEKLTLFANQYEKYWKDKEALAELHKPYDAFVLGAMAEKRNYVNLCLRECDNKDALANTVFADTFKHHINKENKKRLAEKLGIYDDEDC